MQATSEYLNSRYQLLRYCAAIPDSKSEKRDGVEELRRPHLLLPWLHWSRTSSTAKQMRLHGRWLEGCVRWRQRAAIVSLPSQDLQGTAHQTTYECLHGVVPDPEKEDYQ